MVTKKNLLIVVLTTACLTSVLFTALPIRSAMFEYDPWGDLTGPTAGVPDGTINMRDVNWEILRFNTFGTPVNRTDPLNQQAQIDNLTSRINNLETLIVSMNSTISELEDKIAILNSTKMNKLPDWDSGWISISPGNQVYLYHDLNTTNVFVYVIGQDAGGIHQWRFGADLAGSGEYGLFWSNLSANMISVYRMANDSKWIQVRVMIWIIP
jgi:hypothetical protein